MLHSFGGEESRGNGPGSARSVSVRHEVVCYFSQHPDLFQMLGRIWCAEAARCSVSTLAEGAYVLEFTRRGISMIRSRR